MIVHATLRGDGDPVEAQLEADRVLLGVSFHTWRGNTKVRIDPAHVIIEHGGERMWIDKPFEHLYR